MLWYSFCLYLPQVPSAFISFSYTFVWIFTALIFIISSPLGLRAITTYSNPKLKGSPLPSISLNYLLQTTLIFYSMIFHLLWFYGSLFNSLGAYCCRALFVSYENSSGFHLPCLSFLCTCSWVTFSALQILCDVAFSNILLPLCGIFFFCCLQNFIQNIKPPRRAELLPSQFLVSPSTIML